MAKRQVENTIFEETWFMDLPIHYKMLMLYFFITSDHAGLGNLNFKIINTILGYDYEKKDVLGVLKEHLGEYKEGKYHLKKFMDFHYTEDNRSKVYQSAKKKLRNEGLLRRRTNDEHLRDGLQIIYDSSLNSEDEVKKGLVSKTFLEKLAREKLEDA
jgi:hypothetical protein